MRILAVDLGTRRVGLALSDSGGKLATPYEVLNITATAQALQAILKVVQAEAVDQILVGVPVNMDGSIGPAAEAAITWARELAHLASMPLILVDERLSSYHAEQQLNTRKRAGEKLTRGRRKKQLDAVAAAVFLQMYLDGELPALNA